jgi:hypothetical protein
VPCPPVDPPGSVTIAKIKTLTQSSFSPHRILFLLLEFSSAACLEEQQATVITEGDIEKIFHSTVCPPSPIRRGNMQEPAQASQLQKSDHVAGVKSAGWQQADEVGFSLGQKQ